MAALEGVIRDVVADLRGMVTTEASATLARIAAEGRDGVLAAALPAHPTVETWVDGVKGAALAGVKPDGIVRFEFNYLGEIARFVLDTLRQRSPYRDKKPGAKPPTHYRDVHAIFLDGNEIADVPTEIPGDAELVFANLQPYARKIERGLSWQAKDGVYEIVAGIAKRRFGNTAMVRFTYREFPGAGPGGPYARHPRPSRRSLDDRFPCIVITARPE